MYQAGLIECEARCLWEHDLALPVPSAGGGSPSLAPTELAKSDRSVTELTVLLDKPQNVLSYDIEHHARTPLLHLGRVNLPGSGVRRPQLAVRLRV